jgi:hypothetical protein
MKLASYKATRPGFQGIYSRVARTVDASPYSHSELIFSDGMSASSSFIDNGVRFKHIIYDPDHWDIIDAPGDEAKARKWFEDHEGVGYDTPGTLRFGAWFIPHSRSRRFCSEAIAEALGFPDPWRFGPGGLHAVVSYLAMQMSKPPTPT